MSLNDKKKFLYNAERRRKIKEIKNNELNKECFDCGSCYPEYISINNGVFICKDCLIIHNKFPKQISTTLKNNLSSLNSKELQFMYLGGNQKLLEFINYEYPQLQKFKLNILYQTKAMQYYRNNLNYLVYGGPKPIKPNEKINAYELLNSNDLIVKNEKIKLKPNTKVTKINNSKITKEKKRNKSVDRLNIVEKKKESKEKFDTTKLEEEEKRRNSLLYTTSNEDSLKRHKSFYKEMNKLFGPDINNDIDDISNENSIYKKQTIKKENYRRKSDLEFNNKNDIINKYKTNTSKNASSKYKHYPIEHIYNNNYFTLSATKNIFMFTPNKDSIIYKHRKINPLINNQSNNQDLNSVNEIYYKPKIPYLINSNRKNENNSKLFFTLGTNDNNKNDEKDIKDENNIINDSNSLKNNIKSINTYSRKYRKSKEDEIIEDLNIIKKTTKDENNDNNININENNINTKNQNDAKKENFVKKKILELNKDERKKDDNEIKLKNIDVIMDKKDNNNYIIFRNNKKKINENISNYTSNNNENNNNTQPKELKIDNIIKTISNTIHNEIYPKEEEIKNKTFRGDKDKNKTINNNINKNENLIDNNKEIEQNPIRIEEGDEENIDNSQKEDKDNIKKNKKGIQSQKINENKNEINNNNKKNEEEKKNIEKKDNDNNNNKFLEKRKQRFARFLGKKDVENNKNENDKKDINKNEKEIKDINKNKNKNNEKKLENNKEKIKNEKIKYQEKDKIIENKGEKESSNYIDKNKKSQIIRTQESRRSYKKTSTDNSKDTYSKDNHNSLKPSILENKANKKLQSENIPKVETNKFSIRNKYKMKKLNELV